MSLMEVLFSIGILTFGLWGVASTIAIGRISLSETEKCDRTGACGRAALREVEVRGMLNFASGWTAGMYYPQNAIVNANGFLYRATNEGTSGSAGGSLPLNVGQTGSDGGISWLNIGSATAMPPLVIDPLGVVNQLTGNLGDPTTSNPIPSSIVRANLHIRPALAESIFRWSDELTFDTPDDATKRPRGMAMDNENRLVPYPVLGTDPTLSPAATAWTPLPNLNEGGFSWFLTVAPVSSEMTLPLAAKRQFSVSIVVCHRRVFSADGERQFPLTAGNMTCISPSYGGTTLTIPNEDVISTEPALKNNQWILLYSVLSSSFNTYTNGYDTIYQANWYRVVHAGYDTNSTTSYVSLVGPDWWGGTGTQDIDGDGTDDPLYAVVVQGVTGVYTTTIQRDDDLIWNR